MHTLGYNKVKRMRIRSQIDLLHHGFFAGLTLLILVSGFWVPTNERWMVWIPGLAVIAVLAWIIYGTYYVLGDQVLVCRSGPFTERIPYKRIKSIVPCTNLFSSMATARKRLEIRQHDKSFVMGTTYISPRQQTEFMNELLAKCPNLEPTKKP